MSDTVSLLSYKGPVLGAGATWTSEPTILGQYVSLSLLVSSDQDTNVSIQFSNDLFAGGGGFVTITRSFFAGVNDYESSPVFGKWVRVAITNVGGAPTTRISAVVYGSPTNNTLSANLEKVGGKAPEVSIVDSLPLTGFGDLQTADMVPLTQYVFSQAGTATPTSTGSFLYSLYPSLKATHEAGAAGATWAFPAVATGLAQSSTIVLDNGRAHTIVGTTIDKITGAHARYRAGVTVIARFTAQWKSDADVTAVGTNGFANCLIGVEGTGSSFFTFGYRVTTASPLGAVRNNNTDWGIIYNDNGPASDRFFVPRTSFNGDKFDGTGDLAAIDTAALNVFEIRVTYLGAASVVFKALNRATGYWVTLHTLRYANTTTRAFMGEPSIGLRMETSTSGNTFYGATGTFAVSSASFATISCGERHVAFEESHATDASATLAPATETIILAIKNDTTTPGIPVGIDSISLSCDGNKPVTFRIYEGATITASTFAAINLWTRVLKRTAGTVLTGGRMTASYQLGKSDNLFVSFHGNERHLEYVQEFIVTATSPQASDVFASVSFHLE